MKFGVLTIDDGPSNITNRLIEYLKSKKIPAIMFFLGKNLDEFWEMAQYAINSGFIAGNHSFIHTSFSFLDYDKCIKEIEQTDEKIKMLYHSCGIKSYPKLFRFPFLDKGGINKAKIQDYLLENNYINICNERISYDWYKKEGLDTDRDVFITFDYQDYLLADNQIDFAGIYRHLNNRNPGEGGNLFDNDSCEIFLMHDLPRIYAKYENYYEKYIERTIKLGVHFIKPEF